MDLYWNVIFALISLFGMVRIRESIISMILMYKSMKKAPFLTPSSLLSLENLPKNGFFISGLTRTMTPILKILEIPLIVKAKSHFQSSEGFTNIIKALKGNICDLEKLNTFILKDYEGLEYVEIINNAEINNIDGWSLLDVNKKGILSKKIKKILFFAANMMRYMSGKSIKTEGFLKKEYNAEGTLGIKVGESIVIYGNIINTDNKLKIDGKILLKDKSFILNKIKNVIWRRQNLFLLFTIIFCLNLIKLFRFLISHIKKRISNVNSKYLRDKFEKLAILLKEKGIQDNWKCVICFTNCRSLILKPCKHFGICKRCWEIMEKKICPFCKKGVGGIINILPLDLVNNNI